MLIDTLCFVAIPPPPPPSSMYYPADGGRFGVAPQAPPIRGGAAVPAAARVHRAPRARLPFPEEVPGRKGGQGRYPAGHVSLRPVRDPNRELRSNCVNFLPIQNYTVEQKRTVFFKFVQLFHDLNFPQELKAKVLTHTPVSHHAHAPQTTTSSCISQDFVISNHIPQALQFPTT